MKKKFLLKFFVLTISMILIINFTYSQIKFANYYLHPTIDINKVDNLAKYDLLILDPNNLFLNREVLVSIKEKNPDIIFLAYFNPMEIFEKEYIRNWGNKPLDRMLSKYLTSLPVDKNWWLKDEEGKIHKFDKRQKMLNLSDRAEKFYVSYFNKEMRYWEFISRIDLTTVLSDDIWDGIFEDNFETIEWLADYDGYSGVDINNDGYNDSKKEIAKAWEAGQRKRLELIKKHHPDYLILGNKAKIYLPHLTDGKMIENFPDHWLGNWHKNINNAKTMKNVIINFQEERFEMALASALWLYEYDKEIYLSIGQQDSFKDCYQDYKKLGKIKSKTIDTVYSYRINKNMNQKNKILFLNTWDISNFYSNIFISKKYTYKIKMENGIIIFNPNIDPKNPNLEKFKIKYY